MVFFWFINKKNFIDLWFRIAIANKLPLNVLGSTWFHKDLVMLSKRFTTITITIFVVIIDALTFYTHQNIFRILITLRTIVIGINHQILQISKSTLSDQDFWLSVQFFWNNYLLIIVINDIIMSLRRDLRFTFYLFVMLVFNRSFLIISFETTLIVWSTPNIWHLTIFLWFLKTQI